MSTYEAFVGQPHEKVNARGALFQCYKQGYNIVYSIQCTTLKITSVISIATLKVSPMMSYKCLHMQPGGSGMMCYGPLSEGSAPVLALVSVSSVPALRMATATKSASSMSGSSASSSELAATTDADRVRLISSCCARCTSGQGDLRLRDSAVLRFGAAPNEQVKSSSTYVLSSPTRVSVSHTGKWELCGEHGTYLHGPACAS